VKREKKRREENCLGLVMPVWGGRREEGTVLASLCRWREKGRSELSWPRYAGGGGEEGRELSWPRCDGEGEEERRELSWPRCDGKEERRGGNCLGLVVTERGGEKGGEEETLFSALTLTDERRRGGDSLLPVMTGRKEKRRGEYSRPPFPSF